jgi:hypothetical protein
MKYTQKQAKEIEQILEQKGYTKYTLNWKKANHIYWKSFDKQYDENGDKTIGYQVGFAFYDYSDIPGFYNFAENTSKNEDLKCISIAYEMLLGEDKLKLSRVDLTITDSTMTIEEFEQFCNELYSSDFLKKYKKNEEI